MDASGFCRSQPHRSGGRFLGVEYGIPAEFIGGRWPVCLEIKILH